MARWPGVLFVTAMAFVALTQAAGDISVCFGAPAYAARQDSIVQSFAYSSVSIAQAKQSIEWFDVSCVGIVSAKLGDHFYIENADRTSGIRVVAASAGLTVGGEVRVDGAVVTLDSGERAISETPVVTGTVNSAIIYPLGMNLKSTGGGDFGALPAAQNGVFGGVGLNNIGLLARVSGRVGTNSNGDFTLDDGSGVAVAVFHTGTIPLNGDYVTANCVISCARDSNQQIQRRLEVVSFDTVSKLVGNDMIDNGNIEQVGGGLVGQWSTDVQSGAHSFYVAGGAHSGQYCLAIDTTVAGIGRWYRIDLHVLKGARYVFSAWVKTVGSITGNLAGPSTNINFSNKPEWTQLTRTFTATSTSLAPVYLHSLTGTGQVFFDDVSLTMIAGPTVTSTGPVPCADGGPIVGIVISSWQEEHEGYLALDARSIFNQMCGQQPGVYVKGTENPALGRLLYIGCQPNGADYSQDLANVGDEGIVVDVTPNAVVCIGNTPRGTYYAVQELYYRLGCRWIAPFTGGTCIPTVTALELPSQKIVHRPSFDLRSGKMMHNYHYPPSMDAQGISADEAVDWGARNHMNGLKAFYNETWPYGAVRGGGWVEYVGHNLRELVPPEVYFATHPEYFPLVNGVRTSTGYSGFFQICVSNSDVPKIIAQQVIDYFDSNPKADRFSVAQNDGNWCWCECASCKALDTVPNLDWSQNSTNGMSSGMTDRWMYLVNKVADIVAQKYPNKFLMTYAYSATNIPPTRYLPHYNVQVEFCHNGRCFKHPTTDPVCANNKGMIDRLNAWKSITTAPVSFYGYTDFFYPEAAEMYFHSDGDFFKYLRDNGVRFIADEWDATQTTNPLFLNLRARLLWDADTNVDAYIDDFCRIVYGPAATTVKAFFLCLENGVYNAPSEHVLCMNLQKFTSTLVSDSLSLLTTAAAQAGSDTVLQAKIARLRLSVLYAQMCRIYYLSNTDPSVLPQVDPIRQEITSLIQTHGIPIFYGCNMWDPSYRPPYIPGLW